MLDNKIRISENTRDDRFVISHEIGHLILDNQNDYDGFINNCDLNAADCGCTDCFHGWHVKEYQTCAAIEGWSHFYSASVWNYRYGPDCWYRYHNCYDEEAYMDDNCTGDLARRGMEGDWAHFWWDMYSSEGLSVGEIIDIYDGADPEDWAAWNVYNRLLVASPSPANFNYWGSYNGVDH